jgi:hypothetical protein
VNPGTRIQNVKKDSQHHETFTLDGKKTMGVTPKGIYIKDGKKYINQ